MDRMPVGSGGPFAGGGIQFESTQSYLSYLSYPTIVPTAAGSILILHILSILAYHRPTGGESYGLDNRLTAYVLALEHKDRGAV